MQFLVDRDIASAGDAFATFGEVRLFSGRDLRPSDLGEAEVLITRSVTAVNAELLEGSRIRFVGTTTAGFDHVDLAYLERSGIAFASSPGCNARAVAEHVLCCLIDYAAERGRPLGTLRIGIVGYGHVGQALGRLLRALKMSYLACDPPLAARDANFKSVDLDALMDCDVVSVHVPLSDDGAHATRRLIGAQRLASMRSGSLLINAARGGVVDEAALLAGLRDGASIYAAIDCWEGEPELDAELALAVWHGSTHIAGHTLEARINAVVMQQRAVAAWLGREPPALAGPPPPTPPIKPGAGASLDTIMAAVHPLAAHTKRVRELASLDEAGRGPGFDRLRRDYGLRREFASYLVASDDVDAETAAQLKILGFNLA